jgi:DivIVA domain-containing protein
VEREEIERRDFPVGRRGYDPAAVDEHLRRVADRFEAHANAPAPSLSTTTSDQVRQILQAAERSVSEMRARANEEASDHVERVKQSADGMLAKLDDLERELGNLVAALRASGERLIAGLADLQAEIAGGEPAPIEEDFAAAAPAPAADDFAPAPAADSDEAGARLIALNMALSGSSREETARYLAENFTLEDPEALLDDVFARAGR